MIEFTAEEAAGEFEAKFKNDEFEKARSVNSEVNYTDGKEERDYQAVKDFLNTEMFNYVKDLR